jgi:hypothetical protein
VSGAFAAAGLDALQRGHLRHFDNLSRQPANDWSLMAGRSTGQDDFGGYRFQLAYMMYALALTHIHRLPAAPGLFKPVFERLFDKLLLPEVWMYWRDVSRGGSVFNAHLSAGYQEEWDPVQRDNIMYSAYVQSCALLYQYAFRDDRYARPGAITFRHWSYFWGGEAKAFAYDADSLNEHVYWLMAESGFLGVACEPNCIFQICNQPAILGFRLHDLIHGGSRAQDVVRSYEAAWADFGRTSLDGRFVVMLAGDTQEVRPNRLAAPWVDAWTGALMNMWNREFVHAVYPAQVEGLVIAREDGTLSLRIPERPPVMGQRIVSDDCDFGWAAAWMSELGDEPRLQGLLAHADRYMQPQWADNGLYYPRNDQVQDAFGNRTLVEPHTGNVLLAYARLNVPDGLWRLYNEPLDDRFHSWPALVEVGRAIELHTATNSDHALQFRMSARTGEGASVTLGRLPARRWMLTCDGAEIATWSNGVLTARDGVAALVEGGIGLRPSDDAIHDYRLAAT